MLFIYGITLSLGLSLAVAESGGRFGEMSGLGKYTKVTTVYLKTKAKPGSQDVMSLIHHHKTICFT